MRNAAKHIARFFAALLILSAIVYFVIPALLLPAGVWHRQVVRVNPLKAPALIHSVRGDTLVSDRQEFRLAGVTLPMQAEYRKRTEEFLQVVTAQGVEVIRPVEPGGTFILRCEPRISHWCGNDPIRAHYEQLNLNDLLVAFGYATPDETAIGLTEDERLQLRAAEALARERRRGMWDERPGAIDHRFRQGHGLNISDVWHLPFMIEVKAKELSAQQ